MYYVILTGLLINPTTMGNLLLLIHNPSNRNILTDANRRYPILEQPENMKKLLQPKDIISSRRQASNLKHLLTKALFTMQEENLLKMGRSEIWYMSLHWRNRILLNPGWKFTNYYFLAQEMVICHLSSEKTMWLMT